MKSKLSRPVTDDDTSRKQKLSSEPRKISLPTFIFSCMIVAALFFALGTRWYMLPNPFSGSTAPSQLDFSSLNELYVQLKNNYDGTLDATALVEGAKHGMVDAVGDPYTVYMSADEAKEFSNDLNGTFEGVGAELGKVDSQLTILTVIGDSPAQKAGLKSGDVIYKINDEDTSKMTVYQAVTKIRGEKGTSVKLSILRDDETKDYTIVRDAITTPSVTSEILDGNIGYMRITRFADDTSSLSKQAAEKFKSASVKGVILDLRGNGGGTVSSAQDVASLWLDNKVVLSQQTNGVTTETYRSGSSPVLGGIKTVVLVDGGSASASEIVAGALHDNDAATLIGKKTFGKGSMQTVQDLTGGGELKVTIAKWYTPDGKNINKEGITPDKTVDLTDDDIKAGKDPQKDAAITEIKQ